MANEGHIEMNLLNALRRAQQACEIVWNEHLGEEGITIRQALVLDALIQSPKRSQSELMQLTSIDRATVSDIVKRLLRQGLVERVRSETDSRAYEISISPAGKRAWAAAKKAAPKVERDLRKTQAMVDLRGVA
jgi:DNA-binding MarR family transcriptional regulator